MSGLMADAGTALRPHAKCHKSVAIAKRQLAAGAIGMCCANIGEAEILGHAGTDDVLITSPLVTTEKIDRLCSLAKRIPALKLVVDNADNVRLLSAAASSAGVNLGVLVDLDPGMHKGKRGVCRSASNIDQWSRPNQASPHFLYQWHLRSVQLLQQSRVPRHERGAFDAEDHFVTLVQ